MIESWQADPTQIGPLYPLAGSEIWLTVIAVIIWLGWTFWQWRFERRSLDQEVREIRNRKDSGDLSF